MQDFGVDLCTFHLTLVSFVTCIHISHYDYHYMTQRRVIEIINRYSAHCENKVIIIL